jgi:hypothetical protein
VRAWVVVTTALNGTTTVHVHVIFPDIPFKNHEQLRGQRSMAAMFPSSWRSPPCASSQASAIWEGVAPPRRPRRRCAGCAGNSHRRSADWSCASRRRKYLRWNVLGRRESRDPTANAERSQRPDHEGALDAALHRTAEVAIRWAAAVVKAAEDIQGNQTSCIPSDLAAPLPSARHLDPRGGGPSLCGQNAHVLPILSETKGKERNDGSHD